MITAGYLVIAVALAIGAFTTLTSSTWFTLAWVAVSGLGFGLVMPSAMNVTLASLTAERSGSGSALISAMRQVGSVIGVAILGTLISNAYGSRVNTTGLPAAAADLARTGVAGGVEVAHQLGSAELLDVGPVRVRRRHGHHAVDVRRHRGLLRAAGGRVPAEASLNRG